MTVFTIFYFDYKNVVRIKLEFSEKMGSGEVVANRTGRWKE